MNKAVALLGLVALHHSSNNGHVLSSSAHITNTNNINGFVLFAAAAKQETSQETEQDQQVQKFLKAGDKLLVEGRKKYPDAIAQYTKALMLQPDNAKALVRRAELYMMMKNWDDASKDTTHALKSEPDNRKALEIQIKLLGAQGLFLEAASSATALSKAWAAHKNDKKRVKAQEQAYQLNQLGLKWEKQVKDKLSNQHTMTRAEKKMLNRNCVQVLHGLIPEFAKENLELRLQLAECAIVANNKAVAETEMKHILARDTQNLKAILVHAHFMLSMGSVDGARKEVKRCLALDPENPPCVALHKKLKKFSKNVELIKTSESKGRWNDVVKTVVEVLADDADAPMLEELYTWRCQGHVQMKKLKEGIDSCTQAIQLESEMGTENPRLIDVYLYRAELHLMKEAEEGGIDAAQADFNKAKTIQQNNEKVQKFHQKLEGAKKRAALKDYYKILGVKRSADEKEIRRAYRKLSMKFHPDQWRSKDISEEERESNDKRYRDINEAKEILLDDEKRKRYDAGEDVTQPKQQQGGPFHGGHPFGGGNPFGGGGGGFRFNFNG